jgi:Ca-activated chloride channel family protein
LSGTQTAPVTGVSAVSLTFTLPLTPGTYEVRFFRNGTFTLLATSAPITVATPPSVTLSATTGAPGATVTATIAHGPGLSTDWVGLFATGAPETSSLQWQFLSGTQTAPVTGVSGVSLTFTLPPTPGTYEVRFFRNGTFTLLATSAPITIATPSITLSATSGTPGAPVTATIANGPGYSTDWVGLFATGAAETNSLQWQFLSGTHTAPVTGVSGVNLTFTLPPTPGTYEVRFFRNGTFTLLATSAPITVTP